MKKRKSLGRVVAGTAVIFTGLLVTSCVKVSVTPASGQECDGSAAAGGPVVSEPDGSLGLPSMLSKTLTCTSYSQCVGKTSDVLCTVVVGGAAGCDTTAHRCKLKLAPAVGSVPAAQCADGSVRACSTDSVAQGIHRCNITTCDWPAANQANSCTVCGEADGQDCCVGGCKPPLTCKTAGGQPAYASGTGVCKP